MKKSKLIEDIHKMKFEDIYGRYQNKRLSCEEASEILGVSVRTFIASAKDMNQKILMGVLIYVSGGKALIVQQITR